MGCLFLFFVSNISWTGKEKKTNICAATSCGSDPKDQVGASRTQPWKSAISTMLNTRQAGMAWQVDFSPSSRQRLQQGRMSATPRQQLPPSTMEQPLFSGHTVRGSWRDCSVLLKYHLVQSGMQMPRNLYTYKTFQAIVVWTIFLYSNNSIASPYLSQLPCKSSSIILLILYHLNLNLIVFHKFIYGLSLSSIPFSLSNIFALWTH